MPTRHPMQTAQFADRFVTRTQRKVVGVSKNHMGTGSRHLINGQTLDGALGTNRHEARGLDRSMRSQKNTATSRGGCIAVF